MSSGPIDPFAFSAKRPFQRTRKNPNEDDESSSSDGSSEDEALLNPKLKAGAKRGRKGRASTASTARTRTSFLQSSTVPQQGLSVNSPPMSPNPTQGKGATAATTAQGNSTSVLDETLDSSDDEARPNVASDAFDEQVCSVVLE